jgi:hypothetical protein
VNNYGINTTTMTGTQVFTASGDGLMAVVADGITSVASKASGVASMALSGSAITTRAINGFGAAMITLTATAESKGILLGYGKSEMIVSMYGMAKVAALGDGVSNVTFGGYLSVPATMPIPSTYLQAPISRVVHAPADLRTIRVLAEPVPTVRENRSTIVQSESRRAA